MGPCGGCVATTGVGASGRIRQLPDEVWAVLGEGMWSLISFLWVAGESGRKQRCLSLGWVKRATTVLGVASGGSLEE